MSGFSFNVDQSPVTQINPGVPILLSTIRIGMQVSSGKEFISHLKDYFH